MAPNSKKIPAPSDSSSSSEEEQDSSGSGSSSSSSEEEQQPPPQPVTLKPHQQQQDEDEEDSAEDDDEETEESDEPEKLALENPSLKKPQSESDSESKEDEESDSDDDDEAIKSPMVSDFTLKPRVPNSAKRATENSGSSSKNKKAKVSNGGGGQIVRSADVAKKSTSSRVWSGDDEIKLLEGIIAYKAKNGSDSITNLGPFHETVKDLNLSLDVTRTRLYEKLRALKKKYMNNVAKKGDIVFSKPHELKLYKLSEMMWGGEEGGLNEESGSKVKSPDKKSNRAANVSVKKPVENKDMVKKSVENKNMVKTDQVSDEIKDDALDVGSLYPRLAASIELEASTYLPGMSINSKDFTKEMVLKLGKEKAIELEEEWNDYTEMEHRLFAKRLQMIHKHAETFLDVMKH